MVAVIIGLVLLGAFIKTLLAVAAALLMIALAVWVVRRAFRGSGQRRAQ